jgi:hypothetical protein
MGLSEVSRGGANGAGPVRVGRHGGGCSADPGVDCVEVHGEPRPIDDSHLRILIIGRNSWNRVEVDFPIEFGVPIKIDPDERRSCKSQMSEGQCIDMYKACIAATVSNDAFQAFIREFFSKIGVINAARLQSAVLRGEQAKENMCWAIFGTD